MARIQIASLATGVVVNQSGAPVSGATVNVYQHGTTTQVTVYNDETSSTTISQPLTTDSLGHIPGWLLDGQVIDFAVSVGGTVTTQMAYVPSEGGGNVTDRGAWAASTVYNVHDLVEYGGTTWVCATAHTSGATFDETKFTELDRFRGAWQASTRYVAGDIVTSGGVLYSANATFASGASFNATNWTAISGGGMTNPMTTTQDLIVGGASGAPGRLGAGSNGNVLSVSAGNVGWAAPAVGTTANTFTGEQAAPDFKASGITGATAASRYVGGTTSGAPTSGTFAVGDYAVDQTTGAIWACITAGTPGTWAISGSGTELGYAQITSDFTTTTTAAGGVAVTGLTVTVTVGSRPVIVEAGGAYMKSSAAAEPSEMFLLQGATVIQQAVGYANLANEEIPWSMRARLSLAAGSYTFSVNAGNAGGTGTITVAAGTDHPAWIQVTQV